MPDRAEHELETRLDRLGGAAQTRAVVPVPESLLAAVAARQTQMLTILPGSRLSWRAYALAAGMLIACGIVLWATVEPSGHNSRQSPDRVAANLEPTSMLGSLVRANLVSGSPGAALRIGPSPDMRRGGGGEVAIPPTRPIRPGLTSIP